MVFAVADAVAGDGGVGVFAGAGDWVVVGNELATLGAAGVVVGGAGSWRHPASSPKRRKLLNKKCVVAGLRQEYSLTHYAGWFIKASAKRISR